MKKKDLKKDFSQILEICQLGTNNFEFLETQNFQYYLHLLYRFTLGTMLKAIVILLLKWIAGAFYMYL